MYLLCWQERSEFRKEMQRERSILDAELKRMRLEAAAEEERLHAVLEERKQELVQGRRLGFQV